MRRTVIGCVVEGWSPNGTLGELMKWSGGKEDQEQLPPPDQAHQRGLHHYHSPPDKAAFVYDVGGASRSWCCSYSSSLNSFIHSFIPLACAECDDFLPYSRASSIPLCCIPFPSTFSPTSLPSSLTSSCHLFLGLPLSLVASKFICNIFGGILFSSILCTRPNQHNPYCLCYSGFF